MTLKSGFHSSSEVTDPNLLFGHNRPNKLLDHVITFLRLGTNIQIIGERRAGKTSLLKCCIHQLRRQAPKLIPVYLNYREHHLVKGYANAHRLLLAHIHTAIILSGALEPPSIIDDVMVPSLNPLPEIHYQALAAIPDHLVDGLVTSYVNAVNKAGFGIILLLDEYEHLMRSTFEGREGAFFHLRDLSSKSSMYNDSPKPLTYVIAGALPWDQLCEMIGSPELNNIGTIFYIEPIDYSSFQEMWQQCLNDSSEDLHQAVEGSTIDVLQVYKLAGGWPFYIKVIGEHLSIGQDEIQTLFISLLQHFNVIWSRLSNIEREMLIHTQNMELRRQDSGVRNLIRRGLLEPDSDGIIVPRGILWTQFVTEQVDLSITDSKISLDSTTKEARELLAMRVDEIAVLVTEINETSLNVSHKEIFRCSNQDVQTYRDLRLPAITTEQFSHFALSLYNLIFERTTGEALVPVVGSDRKSVVEEVRYRTLENLPKQFGRRRTMVRVIDSIRHHFGKGHLTRLESFNSSGSGLPIEEVLLRYLGSKGSPREQQFLELQQSILKDLVIFLEELRDYLLDRASTGSKSSSE